MRYSNFAMKHPGCLVSTCVVLAAAIMVGRAILRDRELEMGFDTIAAGTDEREVIRTLGPPKRIEGCGEFFGPLTKQELEGCAREYFYASPFAFVLPRYYVVRFDVNKRVKNKTPYSPP